MGCCASSTSENRSAVFLVDCGTGHLSTVSTTLANTQFFPGSELAPFEFRGGHLKFKHSYRTAKSNNSKAGPLLVFPIESTPEGSKPWKHPSDTENTTKALFNHILFHGGEQVVFASWVEVMDSGKKTGSCVAVMTSLGRAFLAKGSKVKDTFHIGDVHTIAMGASPGEVQITLSPIYPSARDPKLPNTYQLSTSPAAAEAMMQAGKALAQVLYANAPPQNVKPNFSGASFRELPLPAPSQDGGFHSAYCMWHNLHSSKLVKQLEAKGQGAAPNFELVTGAMSGDWSGATAIVAARTGLKRLELDISGWDSTATQAAAWAMRYNNVFKTLKASDAASKANLLAPILESNTVLLKFQMAGSQGSKAPGEAMAALGNALARNPAPGFAEIDISGNSLAGDASVAWAGGLSNLKRGTLVVLDIGGCGADESGSASILDSVAAQAKSVSSLRVSGNRLGIHGTNRLGGILAGEPLALQTLDLEECQCVLESLGGSLLNAALSLKSLSKLDVSGNAWGASMVPALQALEKVKKIRIANTGIQPDALQELMLALAGRTVSLDMSNNQAVGAPNGLAAMLASGIGVPSITARDCGLGDGGLVAVVSAAEKCVALKALDVSLNVTSDPGQLTASFYNYLRAEIDSAQFLSAVAGAQSVDAAMAIYSTAMQRAALQATGGSQQAVGSSEDRLRAAMALTQALMPQASGQALEELAVAGSKEQPHLCFGPLMSMPVHLALHMNTSLTKVDISHNGMGDTGARILGTALRANRTLTSLRMDGNNVALEGLKAIRGCLHGNKKLVELPFLDGDMQAQLDQLASGYMQSLSTEVEARVEIGRAFKVYGGGRCHTGMYNAAMAKLKGAKQLQSRTMQGKNKLRTTAAQIQGDVLRNQVVSEIKAAKQLAKQEDKASIKSVQTATKASEKLAKLEESNKKRAWEDRYKLMKQWAKTVKGAAASKASTSWWTSWLNTWGKPYLTKEGLDSLWEAVPSGDQDRYLSTYEYSVEVFGQQKELSDQIRDIKQTAQTAQADAQFHQKEAEYFHTVSVKDPNSVASAPPNPGIAQGRKPGDIQRNFQSTYGATDWAGRRAAICSDINSHISRGPPKDFKWEAAPDPNKLDTGKASSKPPVTAEQAAAMGVPMLSYGTPVEQVQGVPAPSAPPAGAAMMAAQQPQVSVPANFAPNYIPSPTAAAAASAPPPGYPVQSQQAAATAPYRPPEAPQPYQAAAAAPGGAQGYHFYNSYLEDEQRFQNRPQEYHNYYYGPGRYGGAYDQYGDSDYYYDRNGRRRRRYSYDNSAWILPAAFMMGALYSPFYSPWYGPYYGFGYGGGFGYCGGYGYGGWGHHDTYYTEVNNYYGTPEDVAAQEGAQDELGDVPPEDVAEANADGTEGLDPADGGGDGGDADGDGLGGGGGEAEGMDMYGGAGPRDLPDGGNDGSRSDGIKRPSAMAKAVGSCWDESAWEDQRVRLWFDVRWSSAMLSAEAAVLGVPRALSHDRQPLALPSKKPSVGARCTLVTQASLDRRPQILAQAEAWGGRVSLALFVGAPRGSPEAARLVQEVCELHARLEDGPAAVDISLLWALPDDHHASGDERTRAYDRMYPVNALRNLALSCAQTELVFLLDVDFQPSRGLMEAANALRPSWCATSRAVEELRRAAASGRREMLVVAAFEVAAGAAMPSSKRDLRPLIGSGGASGFHTQHFPQGHSPTDYTRWLEARRSYPVEFAEYFEPYVIAARSLVPAYDERFRGYGMNKISHLYSAAAAGFKFKVAPEVFVAAHEHDKSESWEATFGNAAAAEQKVRISALYRRFKQELRCDPALCDPLVAEAPSRAQQPRQPRPGVDPVKQHEQDDSPEPLPDTRKRALPGGCVLEASKRQRSSLMGAGQPPEAHCPPPPSAAA